MGKVCQVCNKGTSSGNNRSHSMRATKRTFKPNIFSKKVDLGEGFKVKVKICSSCYKKFFMSGKLS